MRVLKDLQQEVASEVTSEEPSHVTSCVTK